MWVRKEQTGRVNTFAVFTQHLSIYTSPSEQICSVHAAPINLHVTQWTKLECSRSTDPFTRHGVNTFTVFTQHRFIYTSPSEQICSVDAAPIHLHVTEWINVQCSCSIGPFTRHRVNKFEYWSHNILFWEFCFLVLSIRYCARQNKLTQRGTATLPFILECFSIFQNRFQGNSELWNYQLHRCDVMRLETD